MDISITLESRGVWDDVFELRVAGLGAHLAGTNTHFYNVIHVNGANVSMDMWEENGNELPNLPLFDLAPSETFSLTGCIAGGGNNCGSVSEDIWYIDDIPPFSYKNKSV